MLCLFFIIIGSLTFECGYYGVAGRLGGTNKATFEPAQRNSTSKAATNMYISQMMPSRSTRKTTEDMNLATKYLSMNFKNTSIIQPMDALVFGTWLILKWRKSLTMYFVSVIIRWIHSRRCLGMNCSDLTLWLMIISRFGWFRLIRTPVWRQAALYSHDLLPIWLIMWSALQLIRCSLLHRAGRNVPALGLWKHLSSNSSMMVTPKIKNYRWRNKLNLKLKRMSSRRRRSYLKSEFIFSFIYILWLCILSKPFG
jgi:hypothetical protein